MKNKSVDWKLRILVLFLMIALITSNRPAWTWLMPLCIILIQVYLFLRADFYTSQVKGSVKWKTYRFLTFFGICFCVATYYLIYTKQEQAHLTYLIFLFILVFGNYAPRIPFNRTLGLRLPWTLADEATWRYAHRVIGYASFPCALLLLIVNLYENPNLNACVILLWVLIPSITSYHYHRKERTSTHES